MERGKSPEVSKIVPVKKNISINFVVYQNSYLYQKMGFVKLPFHVYVLPEVIVGSVHDSNENVEHEHIDHYLVDAPENKAHEMRKLHGKFFIIIDVFYVNNIWTSRCDNRPE